jgi:competence protein ComEC
VRAARGPLVALAGLVTGVLVGVRRGPAPAVELAVAGAVLLGVAWWLRSPTRLAVAAVALTALGAAGAQRATDGLTDAPLLRVTGTRVEIAGTVATDPSGPPYTTQLVVRTRDGTRLLVAASGDDAGRLRVLTRADAVTLRGLVRPLGPDDGWLRWRHVAARLERAELLAFAPGGSPWSRAAERARALVLRGTSYLPRDERAQVAGFVIGDTRELPRDLEAAYRDAGLSHLLVVSGANVAFALALAGPLLRRLPLGGRFAGGLVVVALFATITRFEPSVLRASALAATVMLAELLGRPIARLRALTLAVMALLLVDPFLLFLPGFLLSCAATAGIALWSRAVAARIRGPRVVRDTVAVSVAAQLGVAPVLLARFGEVPAVAPLANLLAAPAAEPLGVIGLAGGAIAGLLAPHAPLVGHLVALPLGLLVRWVSTVARAAAAVPVVVDRRGALAVVALVALAAAVGRSRGGTLRRHASRPGGTVPDAAPR